MGFFFLGDPIFNDVLNCWSLSCNSMMQILRQDLRTKFTWDYCSSVALLKSLSNSKDAKFVWLSCECICKHFVVLQG